MKMPGFTAEASLGMIGTHYRLTMTADVTGGALGVVPQQYYCYRYCFPVHSGGLPPSFRLMCCYYCAGRFQGCFMSG